MTAATVGPVVVGFDASPAGVDAVTLAQAYCRTSGAHLIVATVHPAPAAISPGRVDAEWIADRHRAATEVLGRARELIGEDADYRVVASSSAAHGLHDLAEESGAALIVVGSHRQGPEERLFAGSTAERLLSGSACPVAVAPVGMRDRPITGLSRIGVAYIEEPEAIAALTAAATFAETANTAAARAGLRLYTVVAAEAEVLPFGVGRDAERAFLTAARDTYRSALDAATARLPAGLPASGHLRTGDVVEVLAELDATEIDLLYCGSRGYGPLRRVLLGGVSSRLVRRARSPVVVVPR
ncbi:universal stress protein [Virgisporangium aurantiacum]|uniref:Universal stress protein n=1 Tax=Virgisporangium aurantiacum TaxID=175570 RepID=A0A8J3ZAG2_9ACTN|nr:universal stress protein [Virgisporangium aurantiacum]GIJ58010.1 universal stress protein [Virgisporangium aurantiacum]